MFKSFTSFKSSPTGGFGRRGAAELVENPPYTPPPTSDKTYFRQFRAEITASPGSSSTINFSSALDATSDLKALVIYAADTGGSNGVASRGAISNGFSDLTNDYCVDMVEPRGGGLSDVGSGYNTSLLHIYDHSTSATWAKGSYASHTVNGFTINWGTQPTGTGVVMTITGYALCGDGVSVDLQTHYHNTTTAAATTTISFGSLASVDAALIFSMAGAQTAGNRVDYLAHLGTGMIVGGSSYSLVTKADGTDTVGGRVHSSESHFTDGTIAGTTQSGSNRAFRRIDGSITGTNLTLTNTDTLDYQMRFIALAIKTSVATVSYKLHQANEATTTFTPDVSLSAASLYQTIGGYNGGSQTNAQTGVIGQAHFVLGGVANVGSFGYKTNQISNRPTIEASIFKPSTTHSNKIVFAASLPNATDTTSDSDQEQYVTAVNGTTGELTMVTDGTMSYTFTTGVLMIEEVA